ncbi:hypothetical protein [Opitutus terrae]|uniref:hypothetical protein n=1 Tax=Opitutus terrae TaxID=107709 RepID=UPI000318BCFB|nr:hypothetical protein [Opitutus terrae]
MTGDGLEIASGVHHPNGNIYDQVLLTGPSVTVDPDPGEVARVSFVDLNDDIVQVEFSGAGLITVSLDPDGRSGPALAGKYNQPDVQYMKGHASVTIAGSNATTNVTIFSVGTLTAQNQAIFRAGEMYDGIADLARLTIVADPASASGSTFGAIRTGNVQFWHHVGNVGILAANVQVQGPVVLCDLWTLETANPVLTFGTVSQFPALLVAGGDLSQPGGKRILVASNLTVSMVAGVTSHNVLLPAQPLRGVLEPPGPISF